MVIRYAHLALEHQASVLDRLFSGGGRMATKSVTGESGAKSPKQTKAEIPRKQRG
jgi:hypothetical protein